MDHDFWHRRWENNEIGFHEAKPNDLLVQYVDKLALKPNSRIFLPLCGKTLDIGWLLTQGFQVVGIELDLSAVEQLFNQLNMRPEKSKVKEGLTCFKGPNISIYQGDIFELTAHQLGSLDAVYDRAALVALPDDIREQYCQHMLKITASAKQLLIVFEYDQSQMFGPPFSIREADISHYYGHQYSIKKLHSRGVSGGVRGLPANELAWLLMPLSGTTE